MPPAHIRNAPTRLMKELGYGKGYQYDPDTEEGFSGQNYFPDGIERRVFYAPEGRGRRGARQGAAGALGGAAGKRAANSRAAGEALATRAQAALRSHRRAIAAHARRRSPSSARLVIYEDADDPGAQQAGRALQPGRADRRRRRWTTCCAAFAKSNGKRPRLVHRLDRDTSGVILTAKTKPAAGLPRQGADGAGGSGRPTSPSSRPARPSPRDGPHRGAAAARRASGARPTCATCAADHPDAESAVTGYRTLAAGDEAALMELRPAHRPHAPAARPPGLASAARSPATPATAAR